MSCLEETNPKHSRPPWMLLADLRLQAQTSCVFSDTAVPGAAHAAHRPLIPSHWACHPESGGGGSWATFRVNPFRVPMPAVARETGWDPYPSRQDPSQLCLAPGPTPQEHVSLLRRSGSPTRRGSGLQQPPPAPSTHRPRLRPF